MLECNIVTEGWNCLSDTFTQTPQFYLSWLWSMWCTSEHVWSLWKLWCASERAWSSLSHVLFPIFCHCSQNSGWFQHHSFPPPDLQPLNNSMHQEAPASTSTQRLDWAQDFCSQFLWETLTTSSDYESWMCVHDSTIFIHLPLCRTDLDVDVLLCIYSHSIIFHWIRDLFLKKISNQWLSYLS